MENEIAATPHPVRLAVKLLVVESVYLSLTGFGFFIDSLPEKILDWRALFAVAFHWCKLVGTILCNQDA